MWASMEFEKHIAHGNIVSINYQMNWKFGNFGEIPKKRAYLVRSKCWCKITCNFIRKIPCLMRIL